MRDLSAQSGIGTDGDYLNGDLVDGQTIVGEGINQDIVQFFQKLADLAGIVPSGDPDNEANGYQLITALAAFAKVSVGVEVVRIDIGVWNMNTTGGVNVPYVVPAGKRIAFARAKIFRDSDSLAQESSLYRPLEVYDSILSSGVLAGSVVSHNLVSTDTFSVVRTTGGDYDNINYESRPNRGVIYVFLEDIPT